MPSIYSSPYHQMENPAILSLLRHATNTNPDKKRKKSGANNNSSSSSSGGLLRIFKLFPMLTSGCKMVALLAAGRPRRALLKDSATTGTIFGYRKGRMSLAIQEDPHKFPDFIIELPILVNALHKEMASDVVRIALESETKSHKRKLMEEYVWAVYCNGRKIGYCIRRTQMSDDELHVMQLLRGVSMGAGVLPSPASEKETMSDGELTYMRARFERKVGSKDSEALYMINPDGAVGPEFSIFFIRVK